MGEARLFRARIGWVGRGRDRLGKAQQAMEMQGMEDLNTHHWAYIWGFEVGNSQSEPPGSGRKIGFDHPRFDARAMWHYNEGKKDGARAKTRHPATTIGE